MANELTTPITRSAITAQAITRFEVSIPQKIDEATGALVIDRDGVLAGYMVETYLENGQTLPGAKRREVPFSEWPPAFKAAMQGVYSMLETDAKNTGLMGPGTSESLE